MKRILLLISLSLLLDNVQAQVPAPTADAILRNAYVQAAREKKNVFVLFHASWCGWCKRMDRSMTDTACKQFFDRNYVICHLVVNESKEKKSLENPGAAEFLEKNHGKEKGIPFWLVLDPEGKLLADALIRKTGDDAGEGDNSGCPATEKEVAHFISVLQKTSSLTVDQLEIIRKRFRENDR